MNMTLWCQKLRHKLQQELPGVTVLDIWNLTEEFDIY
jgi:hypothetical protein